MSRLYLGKKRLICGDSESKFRKEFISLYAEKRWMDEITAEKNKMY
jgi:hypothetical protein